MQTGLGGSCLICGRKRSGKSLILDQIIKRLPNNLRIVNADGEKCSSFAASAKILQKHGLDIGNFEEQKNKKEIGESVGFFKFLALNPLFFRFQKFFLSLITLKVLLKRIIKYFCIVF